VRKLFNPEERNELRNILRIKRIDEAIDSRIELGIHDLNSNKSFFDLAKKKK